MRRFAAIDIGSNTVLLLVAEVGEDGSISPLQEIENTTRLGRGLGQTGRLHSDSLAKTLDVIDSYLGTCKGLGADEIHLVGTSALRAAENTDDLVKAVEDRTGLTIRIISGDEEARLSYLAVQKEMPYPGSRLVMDIGGGSVELIRGDAAGISNLFSLEIGAVRLTERFLLSDPVTEEEFRRMIDHIDGTLHAVDMESPQRMVGLGGTITTLASVHLRGGGLDPIRVHGSSLSRQEVSQQVLLYMRTTLSERLGIPGLPRERADLILAGAAVLRQAMDFLRLEELTVSCHGLRYGLLCAAAEGAEGAY